MGGQAYGRRPDAGHRGVRNGDAADRGFAVPGVGVPALPAQERVPGGVGPGLSVLDVGLPVEACPHFVAVRLRHERAEVDLLQARMAECREGPRAWQPALAGSTAHKVAAARAGPTG